MAFGENYFKDLVADEGDSPNNDNNNDNGNAVVSNLSVNKEGNTPKQSKEEVEFELDKVVKN
jgi:hypothetical protein